MVEETKEDDFNGILLKFALLLFVVAILVIVSSMNVKADLNDSSLIGHWSFDVNEDEDKGATACTLVNAIHVTSECLLDDCYYFDSSGDYIHCADYAGLTFGTSDFTWNAWVYMNESDYLVDRMSIIAPNTGNSNNNVLLLGRGQADPLGDWQASKWTANNKFEDASESEKKWIMITLMRKGNNLYLYKNTTLIGSAWAYSENLDMNDISFGAFLGTNTYYGRLDEISLYNRNLTTTELGYLYNSGTGCNPVIESCPSGYTPGITPLLDFNTTIVNGSRITYVDWEDDLYYWNFTDIRNVNNSLTYDVLTYIGNTLIKNDSKRNINTTKNFNLSFQDYSENTTIKIYVINVNASKTKIYNVQLVTDDYKLNLVEGDLNLIGQVLLLVLPLLIGLWLIMNGNLYVGAAFNFLDGLIWFYYASTETVVYLELYYFAMGILIMWSALAVGRRTRVKPAIS